MVSLLDGLNLDLRCGLRQLRRAPLFSLVVVVTLALSVGANTALFSLLNALVLRRLPVRDPQHLAVISVTDPRGLQTRFIYDRTFTEFTARQHAFQSVTMYVGGGILRSEARGVQVDAGIESATPGYYDMLGVRPFLGRFISAADAPSVGEAAPVVVLGYRLWQRLFSGDPHAVGETLTVDGMPLTIIGVTPPEFHGLYVDGGADFSVPLSVVRRLAGDPKRPTRARNLIGRLRPGVSLDQARVEIETLWPAIQQATIPSDLAPIEQDELRQGRVQIESVATGFSSLRLRYANPLFVLVGLTALLLVIGCLNLSGLLLARTIARTEQLATRVALGATRARLVRQLIVESMLLSTIGVVLAVPLAYWASRLIGATLWARSLVPLAMSLTPDARVLSLAGAIAIGTGLLVCVLPAALGTGTRLELARLPMRGTVAPTGRTGKALVVVQVALSLVLLSGAGLFARSLANLRANGSAFPTTRIVWTRLWQNPGERPAVDEASYYSELARQVSYIPGVESVGFSYYFPASFSVTFAREVIARSDVSDRSSEVGGLMEVVSPRFFDTVRIPRIQGRDFTWQDDTHGAPVVIVNATLSHRLFPQGNAVGQRIRVGRDPARQILEIIGVVGDAPVGNIREPDVPVAFRPILQEPRFAGVPDINVRTSGNVKAVGEQLRGTVASLGRHYVRNLSTLEEQVDQSLLQERLIASLSSFFAGLAVLLACVGVYALLAYAVARRTREIGVRMALGASRPSVLRMIVREGLTLALLGIVLGVPTAIAAGRLIGAQLYGLAPNDAVTLTSATAMFVIVAALAGLLPAYRASTIDPMAALRHD